MKPNSISGVAYQVEDLSRTAAFYEALGFRRGKDHPGRATFYVNWFFVTFIEGPRDGEPGSGVSLYIKVDDVDEFHGELVAAGMSPAGQPQKGPSGGREFQLRDPDGYLLVFFKK
jgi:catechol 2,3-dioxygenase-like lactoylglutathione lyase family enzyme